MSTILISDLTPIGADLFSDSESYLTYLTTEELGVQGGITPTILAVTVGLSYGVSISTISVLYTDWG